MPTPFGNEPFARLTWDRGKAQVFESASIRAWGRVNKQKESDHIQGNLYLGESAGVMSAVLPDYEEQIDLIYLDPPFLTGNAYRARIGRNEDSRRPQDWETIQGYQDTWENGAQYLDMLYPRLKLMHRLLAPTGSLYLHLDWHASAYGRVLLDEIFGPDRLLNEIVWVYHGPSPIKSAFNRKHDTILVYTKSNEYTFNADDVRIPYKESTLKTFASSKKAGFGKKPKLKRGKVPEDWWYFPVVARLHKERTGYPTQKPEALMERIIRASTNADDLVADFFSGSGTTASVAAKLGRRWIACDPAQLAFTTTYRRLLRNDQAGPFRLWRDSKLIKRAELELEIEVQHGKSELQVELKSALSKSNPDLSFPDEITIWEIDWEYDGVDFHSMQQSVRGWRDEELPTKLTCVKPLQKSKCLAIRAFDNRGRFGIIEHKLSNN